MAKNSLRNKVSSLLLSREIINRKRIGGRSISFEDAKTIGVLYDATSDSDYELVKAYARNLMSYSKDVVALGYFNEKELPGSRLMKLGLDFFPKKSLNWKMRPSNPIVNNFLERSFDILILLNTHKCIPLLYTALETRATFKIGRYEKGLTGMLDFMVKEDGLSNMKNLITQINHYLMLIKNEKAK